VRGYLQDRSDDNDETAALTPSFVALPAPAEAVVTYSPPLRSISDAFLACIVQNLSAAAVDVEAALIDTDGSVISLSLDEVAPGRVMEALTSDENYLGAYCRFTFTGNAAQVRTFSALYTSGSPPHLIFPARPAEAVGSVVKFTPPVSSPAGAATTCVVQNFTANVISANVSLIDSDGTDSGFEFISPGDVETVAGVTDATTNAICRIQFGAASNLARGYISRFPSGMFANTDLLEEATTPGGIVKIGAVTYTPPRRSAAPTRFSFARSRTLETIPRTSRCSSRSSTAAARS
jgi:hypothetical protein